MTGSQLKLGHEFGRHAAYVNSWVSILKDEPFELYRAAADAQKITDYILSFEQKRSRKESAEIQHSFRSGDQIRYNGSDYEISGLLPGGRVQVNHRQTGRLIHLSPEDGLYRSLMEAMLKQTELHTSQEIAGEEPLSQSFKR